MSNLLFVLNSVEVDPDVYKAAVVVFVIFLIMIFISSLLRIVLDHKLKNKIIQKEALTDEMLLILQSNSKEVKNNNIKWFIILFSIGAGLFVVNYFPPIGIHSLAIMVLSLSIGFLAFFIYLKQDMS